jgi:hypothetical protein
MNRNLLPFLNQAQMSVSAGGLEKVDHAHRLEVQTNEERKLAEMMIPKKKRRLYKKIMFAKKKKAQEVIFNYSN